MNKSTTWEWMVKYNLPAPGSHIRVLSHLDSYVTVGGEYKIGWNTDSMTVSISNLERSSGTHCNVWQFEGCHWEYIYNHCEKPHLAWPRAPIVWYVSQCGRDFYCYKSLRDMKDCYREVAHFESITKVRDGNIEDAEFARTWFLNIMDEQKVNIIWENNNA